MGTRLAARLEKVWLQVTSSMHSMVDRLACVEDECSAHHASLEHALPGPGYHPEAHTGDALSTKNLVSAA